MTWGLSVPGGDDGGITPGGGGTIVGAGAITGVITGGTDNRCGGTGDPGGTGSTGVIGGADVPGDAGDNGGTGGTSGTGGRCLTLKSGPHVSGPVASPASGIAAMIGTRSTSQVTSRVLLGWPDNVTTFTRSHGWFRPLLR